MYANGSILTIATYRIPIMATATKAPNYTPEQSAAIVARYVAAPKAETVDELAKEFGKTVRSIVAKLSREKVYVKKEYATKTGEPVQKKDETADAIGAVLKLTEAEIDSLTKANKTALVKIFAALANSKPLENGESPAVMVADESTASDSQE